MRRDRMGRDRTGRDRICLGSVGEYPEGGEGGEERESGRQQGGKSVRERERERGGGWGGRER